jgi:hypothetical protein
MMSISGLDDDDELSVRLGDYIFRPRVQIGRGPGERHKYLEY